MMDISNSRQTNIYIRPRHIHSDVSQIETVLNTKFGQIYKGRLAETHTRHDNRCFLHLA
jgi:hypothetical protein